MKAVLIADSAALFRQMKRVLEPRGFGCIQYRGAVKAMFNLDEIEPDVLFVSTVDFPRHWKIIAWLLRSIESPAKPVLFLIKNSRFSTDDAQKAVVVGAAAILDENIFTEEQTPVLYSLLERFRLLRAYNCSRPFQGEINTSFFFIHPLRHSMVTGSIECYNGHTLVFRPDVLSLTISLKEGTQIEDCTLFTEGKKISLKTLITKNNGSLTLRIIPNDF